MAANLPRRRDHTQHVQLTLLLPLKDVRLHEIRVLQLFLRSQLEGEVHENRVCHRKYLLLDSTQHVRAQKGPEIDLVLLIVLLIRVNLVVRPQLKKFHQREQIVDVVHYRSPSHKNGEFFV